MSLPIILDLPLPTMEHLSASVFYNARQNKSHVSAASQNILFLHETLLFQKHLCSSLCFIKHHFTVFAIMRAQVSTKVFLHKAAS